MVGVRSWVDDNKIRHPSNWNIWTENYKKNVIGLTWEDDETPFNHIYYSGKDSDGKLIERDLTSLKSNFISFSKQKCNDLLSDTDWYVTRKYERDVAIPSEISAYRTNFLDDPIILF